MSAVMNPSRMMTQHETPSGSSLTREQIVDRILSINVTAPIDFLASFSDRALGQYLEHLQVASMPRDRHSRWVRPSNARAVAMHETQD